MQTVRSAIVMMWYHVCVCECVCVGRLSPGGLGSRVKNLNPYWRRTKSGLDVLARHERAFVSTGPRKQRKGVERFPANPPAICVLISTRTFYACKSRLARIRRMRNLGGGNDVTVGIVNAVGTAAACTMVGWAELNEPNSIQREINTWSDAAWVADASGRQRALGMPAQGFRHHGVLQLRASQGGK